MFTPRRLYTKQALPTTKWSVMQCAVSLLLLWVYMAVSVRALIPMGAFWLNQQYIAEQLCENKEVPQMRCGGKCYLKKQLNKMAVAELQAENTRNNSTNSSEVPPLPDLPFTPHIVATQNLLPNVSACCTPFIVWADRLRPSPTLSPASEPPQRITLS